MNKKNKPKISGIVLTHNNERTIKECIESMKPLIDELIIIDDYSTDKTLEIIKKIYPGARIYKRKLNNDFASQRNFGVRKSKYEWVLMIDSDEILSNNLKKEILLTLRNPKYKAYTCHFFDIIIGKKTKLIRPILFSSNLKWHGKLHENINTKTKRLNSVLIHNTYRNVGDRLRKFDMYSEIDSEKYLKRNYNKAHIFLMATLMPIKMFIKWYVFDGYWKKGLFGLIYSMFSANIWIIKALKLYEKKYIKKIIEKNKQIALKKY